jgi:hypothetical protein
MVRHKRLPATFHNFIYLACFLIAWKFKMSLLLIGSEVVSRQVCPRRGIMSFLPRNPFWGRKASGGKRPVKK